MDVRGLLFSIRITCRRQVDVRPQGVAHVEAGADGARIDEVSQEEESGGEDDDRGGDLRGYEGAAKAQLSLAMEIGRDGFFERLPGGQQSAGEYGEAGEERGI